MADRLTLGRIWANTGDWRDPGDAKYSLGWGAEIPTYQGLNYLQYKSDLAFLALAERGVQEWGADITYALRSQVWDNVDGKVYIALVASPNTLLSPSSNLGEWGLSAMQVTRSEYGTGLAASTAHINNTANPHGVTPSSIGAYTVGEIDQLFDNAYATLALHEDDTSNPHNTTAIQTGAVPATGGTFTGSVNYEAERTGLNYTATGATIYAPSAGGMYLEAGGYLFGVDGSGNAVYFDGVTTQTILNENTYLATGESYEGQFSAPQADLVLKLAVDVNIQEGFGNSYFDRANAQSQTDKSGVVRVHPIDHPVFTDKGLFLQDGTNTTYEVDADLNQSGFAAKTLFWEGTPKGNSTPVRESDTGANRFYISASQIYLRYERISGGVTNLLIGPAVDGVNIKVAATLSSTGAKVFHSGVQTGELAGAVKVVQFGRIQFGTDGSSYMRQYKVWASILTPNQIATL